MPERSQVPAVVMKFAAIGTIVTSPQNQSDPIFPALSNLSNEQFQQFRNGLAQALAEAGFSLALPFQELRDCTTWTQVCIVVAAEL
jgi:hypothetical protein